MTREQFILQIEATQGAFRRFLVALCCGDAAQADDIAQEAYMKAYLKCDALENADKFKAWIFRIGYNAFVDSRRSAMVSDGYDRAQAVASAESADEAFRYQELYAALRRLPPKERSSVLLYYMEGYSIKEIADLEDSSQDSVKKRLSRGREQLRGWLTR